MQWSRCLVLLLALGAAIGAGTLVRRNMAPPVQPATKAEPARAEILVARRALAVGETVQLADLRWQPWPADAVPATAFARKPKTQAPSFEPALLRYPLIEGEPLAESKLVRAGDGSVMAALITPGKRAVAIPVREESAAGGLIQPNDRVDLIWTPQKADRRDMHLTSRMLLRGVKVLATGQSFTGQSRSAKNRTATLELTPKQAKSVASALAGGDISLALISAADKASPPVDHDASEWEDDMAPQVKIIKFGR